MVKKTKKPAQKVQKKKVEEMTKKHLFFVYGFLTVLALGAVILYQRPQQDSRSLSSFREPSVTPVVKNVPVIRYKGENGVDALTLLQRSAKAEEDQSGMVVVINNVKADVKSREYWAFYVNGKLASVGPKDYVTRDSDQIEWKIEHY